MTIIAGTPIIDRNNNIKKGIAHNETFEVNAIKQNQHIITVFDD